MSESPRTDTIEPTNGVGRVAHGGASADMLAFLNRLRVLHSIDYLELVDAGAIEGGDIETWALFQREPVKFFIRADDTTAARLWDLIERRHRNAKQWRSPAPRTCKPDVLDALKSCRNELAAYREAIKSLFPIFEAGGFERPSYDGRLARLDALIARADAAIASAGG